MLRACVQKFDVTGNFENFWELNMAIHASILDGSKIFVLAYGASRVTINAILSCIGADPKSNSKSIMNSR